ncbi:MAG: indolepyruvate oxidoreductase subunit beta, partial [Anaerolineae bacterium]
QIVLAGVGGQGVLFATKLLTRTALALGLETLGSETHGMSQRGGSVASHLKIGGFASPLVRRGNADFLFGLDPHEAYRAMDFLKSGGVCFVNCNWSEFPSRQARAYLDQHSIQVLTCDADGIALGLGMAALANVALIGFASAHPAFPLARSELRATLSRLSPQRLLSPNLRAFDAGYEFGLLAGLPHPALEAVE